MWETIAIIAYLLVGLGVFISIAVEAQDDGKPIPMDDIGAVVILIWPAIVIAILLLPKKDS